MSIYEKSHKDMVYEFMVALASNPQVIDMESTTKENVDYALHVAVALADKFVTGLVEVGGE